jgi:hypothetical protein
MFAHLTVSAYNNYCGSGSIYNPKGEKREAMKPVLTQDLIMKKVWRIQDLVFLDPGSQIFSGPRVSNPECDIFFARLSYMNQNSFYHCSIKLILH